MIDEVMTQNMSPELIAQLVELGIIPGELEQSQSDILRAQEMQDKELPQGMHVGRRGTYIASNPLSGVAHVWEKYEGQKREEEARKMADILRGKQVDARKGFFDAYSNQGTPPPTIQEAAALRRPPSVDGGY